MTASKAVTEDRAAPVLRVRGLSVGFRTEDGSVASADRVDLDVGAGEIVALVGESGCGKSVTAMSFAGLLPQTVTVTGSAELAGRELIGAPEKVLQTMRGGEVAYIFQEPMTSLNPVLTIGRQLTEVLGVHERLDRATARRRAIELLELVDLPAAERRFRDYPHQLSGGMRQRVMIAMAVACDPKLLVADEPTTALDVTVQAGILDLLRDLRDRLGTSVLLITHNLGVVADVADRVVVMYAGRVVEQASVEELFANPRHHYTAALLGASPAAARLRSGRLREIPGLVPTLSEQPDRCTFADRCPAADDQCRSAQPVLTEAGDASHRVACWHPVRKGRADDDGVRR